MVALDRSRFKLFDDPCIRVLWRNLVRSAEPPFTGWSEAEARVVVGVAEGEHQPEAPQPLRDGKAMDIIVPCAKYRAYCRSRSMEDLEA